MWCRYTLLLLLCTFLRRLGHLLDTLPTYPYTGTKARDAMRRAIPDRAVFGVQLIVPSRRERSLCSVRWSFGLLVFSVPLQGTLNIPRGLPIRLADPYRWCGRDFSRTGDVGDGWETVSEHVCRDGVIKTGC
ncbi:hypothetical protein F4861DRAFT_492337 [Xylaria intraflava]|nr:hypothetical protein F4861DRAFT_492337 [Xylaria intraflava]